MAVCCLWSGEQLQAPGIHFTWALPTACQLLSASSCHLDLDPPGIPPASGISFNTAMPAALHPKLGFKKR
jgi:hypothetical protein